MQRSSSDSMLNTVGCWMSNSENAFLFNFYTKVFSTDYSIGSNKSTVETLKYLLVCQSFLVFGMPPFCFFESTHMSLEFTGLCKMIDFRSDPSTCHLNTCFSGRCKTKKTDLQVNMLNITNLLTLK